MPQIPLISAGDRLLSGWQALPGASDASPTPGPGIRVFVSPIRDVTLGSETSFFPFAPGFSGAVIGFIARILTSIGDGGADSNFVMRRNGDQMTLVSQLQVLNGELRGWTKEATGFRAIAGSNAAFDANDVISIGQQQNGAAASGEVEFIVVTLIGDVRLP